ncbi:hypothetical protein FHU38_001001 [Saccharomonospora amisosensis]|uniref:Acyltransferase 3 domain-containing protein n=1 Tax=Saccharomonospora amisosensis TaxID=1128677 RepID=A0A7X5UMW3_9PSEU|nr:acyltransferase [Saccharomonospora amisosensis]NIJ10657.1 hypothetical protein [Saccharomonospora amisosensis]
MTAARQAHDDKANGGVTDQRTRRVPALDTLRAALVAWIIGGHALLGYSAVGGWAYDEVNEVTFTPVVELVLIGILGPSALFVLGTFFMIAGLFTPGPLARRGPAKFAGHRAVRLGLPFVLSLLVLWPLSVWLAYYAAGRSVTFGWVLVGRERMLDSGALWFAEVLLVFSLAYASWRTMTGEQRSRGLITGKQLVVVGIALALVTFVVRLWTQARATEVLDLHLWQWPQLAVMFWLGVTQSHTGLRERVPTRLYHGCGVAVAGVILALPVLAAVVGVGDVAAQADPFLGGWHWQALLLATVEATLVVAGSMWLLGFAQRRFSGTGPVITGAARGSFAAFVIQGPVLILLAVAMRPLPLPAEVKGPLLAVLAIVACFGLGWLAVTRTPLGKLL